MVFTEIRIPLRHADASRAVAKMLLRTLLIAALLTVTTRAAAIECPDQGGYLTAGNIASFDGCTHALGNLIINQTSLDGDPSQGIPPLSPRDLTYLSSMQEIDGYLLIQDLSNENITNLRFLRNLEIINGLQTIELRPGQQYSMIVEGCGYLETLGLASLKAIVNGGLRISDNPRLCLVDTITLDELLVNSALRRIGGLGTDCSSFTCSDECVVSRGCWGTLDDECIECRNYNYLGTCVHECDMSVSFADDTLRVCIPLPSEVASNTTALDGYPSIIASSPVPSSSSSFPSFPPFSPSSSSPSTSFSSTSSSSSFSSTSSVVSSVSSPNNSSSGISEKITIIIGVSVPLALSVILFVTVLCVVLFCVKTKKAKRKSKEMTENGIQNRYSENPAELKGRYHSHRNMHPHHYPRTEPNIYECVHQDGKTSLSLLAQSPPHPHNWRQTNTFSRIDNAGRNSTSTTASWDTDFAHLSSGRPSVSSTQSCMRCSCNSTCNHRTPSLPSRFSSVSRQENSRRSSMHASWSFHGPHSYPLSPAPPITPSQHHTFTPSHHHRGTSCTEPRRSSGPTDWATPSRPQAMLSVDW